MEYEFTASKPSNRPFTVLASIMGAVLVIGLVGVGAVALQNYETSGEGWPSSLTSETNAVEWPVSVAYAENELPILREVAPEPIEIMPVENFKISKEDLVQPKSAPDTKPQEIAMATTTLPNTSLVTKSQTDAVVVDELPESGLGLGASLMASASLISAIIASRKFRSAL
ncbi:MAG: hypothetical protein ABFQ89_00530 [Chloroflexota bacterium]